MAYDPGVPGAVGLGKRERLPDSAVRTGNASDGGCRMTEPKHQRCEVYSRVVGYLRPVGQFNVGQRQQFSDRRTFALGLGPETGIRR